MENEIIIRFEVIAPKVIAQNKMWHPNIEVHTGQVIIPILGHDWRPVLSLNTVVLALQLIFLEPNANGSANAVARANLSQNPSQFCQDVQRILRGGHHYGHDFEPLWSKEEKKVEVGSSRKNKESPSEKRVKRSRPSW